MSDKVKALPRYKVFVYGTLRKGGGANDMMNTSMFLGYCYTPRGYSLLDLGSFPTIVNHGEGRVYGEVYEISQTVMEELET